MSSPFKGISLLRAIEERYPHVLEIDESNLNSMVIVEFDNETLDVLDYTGYGNGIPRTEFTAWMRTAKVDGTGLATWDGCILLIHT